MVILRLRIKTADEWKELAPSDTVVEPIFVPTTDVLSAGQQVIVEVSANLVPNKVLIRGIVPAWRPALPRVRVRAGATVQLDNDEQTKLTFLHDVLSGRKTDVSRRLRRFRRSPSRRSWGCSRAGSDMRIAPAGGGACGATRRSCGPTARRAGT